MSEQKGVSFSDEAKSSSRVELNQIATREDAKADTIPEEEDGSGLVRLARSPTSWGAGSVASVYTIRSDKELVTHRDRNEEQERLEQFYDPVEYGVFSANGSNASVTNEEIYSSEYHKHFAQRAEKLKVDLEERKFAGEVLTLIETGDLKGIKELIDTGKLNVNYRLSHLKPIVLLAAQHGKLEIVKYLVSKNCDINAVDQSLKTALMRAAETKRLAVVKFLIENGADVYARDMFDRTAFELCVRSDAAHLKGDILCLIAKCFDSKSHHLIASGLEKLFEIQRRRHENVDSPHTLADLSKVVIERSPKPLEECLKFAEKFHILGKESLSFQKEYKRMAIYFTEVANGMVNTMSSDIVASWVLESSVMDVALDANNNLGFFNNARINRILDIWWHGTGWQYRKKYSHEASLGHLHPAWWVVKPRAKFIVDAIMYFIFVCIFSAFLLGPRNVHDPIDGLETVLYLFVIGHIQRAISKLRLGVRYFKRFIRDGWNQMDFTISFLFIAAAFLRLSSIPREINPAEKINFIGTETAYRVIMGCAIVLMWFRLLFIATMFSGTGPLVRIINRMVIGDLTHFTWVMLAVVTGFSLAFHALSRGTLNDLSFGTLLFKLFETFTGEITLSATGYEYVELEVATQAFLVVYIFASSILLLNLLIAMMATTYENIKEKSINEYNLSRAQLIWHYNDPNQSLPPPLNTLILLLNVVIYAGTQVTCFCFSSNPNNRQYCGHCGQEHREQERIAMLGDPADINKVAAIAVKMPSVNPYDKEWIVQRYIQLMADNYYRDRNKTLRYARYRHKLVRTLQSDICQRCCRLLTQRATQIGLYKQNTALWVFTAVMYVPLMLAMAPVTLLYTIPRKLKFTSLRNEDESKKNELKLEARRKAEAMAKSIANIPVQSNSDAVTFRGHSASIIADQELRKLRPPHDGIGIPQDIGRLLRSYSLPTHASETSTLLTEIHEQREQIHKLQRLVEQLVEQKSET